jgi:fibronectin-binding autotransporter adhesin
MNQLLKCLLFFLMACFIAATPLCAADLTWTYAGVNHDFNNGANWQPGSVAPTSADTAYVLTTTDFPVISSNAAANNLLVGSAMPNIVPTTPGELDITGGTTTVTTTLRVGGAVGDSYLKMNGGTLTKLAGGNSPRIGYVESPTAYYSGATGHLELSNGATVNMPRNQLSVGLYTGATGYLTMDHATINHNEQFTTGQWILYIGNFGGTGFMSMTDSHVTEYGSSVQVGNQNDTSVGGSGHASNGTLDMIGASTLVIKPINDPNLAGAVLFIGVNGGATGTVNVYDTSTISVPFGALSCGNSTGTGYLNMYDSTSMTCDAAEIGVNTGTGTVVLSGSSALTVTGSKAIAVGGALDNTQAGTGSLTLNGNSTVTAPGVVLGHGSAGTLTFNGGTLKASANSTDFLQTLNFSLVEIQDFGATINVDKDGLNQPLSVTIGCQLTHSGSLATDGGLTKTGAGTLLYNGSTDITGPTRVNAGTFGGIAYMPTSGLILAGGATLVPGDPNSTNSALTVASIAAASGKIVNAIDCSVANGNNNKLVVFGDATLTGTHFAPQFVGGTPSGSYPLLTAYGTLSVSGLVLEGGNSIPNTRQTVGLTWDTVPNPDKMSVYLTASGTALTDTWTGAVSGVWNANGANNWFNGTDQKFMNWDTVVFDSSDSQPTVTLNEHVYVAGLSFSGANNYVISGSGKITGVSDTTGAPLSIAGPGSVAFQTNGNLFSWLTLGPATMSVAGTGSVTVTGQAADLQVGAGAGNSAKLSLTDTAAFTVGQANVTVGTDGGDGTLEMTGSSTFKHLNNNGGYYVLYVGVHAGSTGTMTMTGGTATTPGALVDMGPAGPVAVGTDGSTATLTMDQYSKIVCHNFSVGSGTESSTVGDGTVKMYGHSSINSTGPGYDGWMYVGKTGTGTVELYENASITAADAIDIGDNDGRGGGTGKVTLSGNSTLTSHGGIWVGNEEASSGELSVYGNATVNSVEVELEVPFWGTGVLNVGDGNPANNAVVNCQQILLGYDSSSVSGIVNLNAGGTIVTNNFYTGGGTGAPLQSIVNFNGGILKATADNPTFISNGGGSLDFQLNVLEGGAKFDSNGHDIAMAMTLSHAGVDAIDGGLEKLGAGRLTLTGPIEYTGTTVIDAGALIIDNGLTTELTTVSGAGKLEVLHSSVVNATSISCDSLQIGGVVTAVPEPSVLILLILAGAGLLFRAWRKA